VKGFAHVVVGTRIQAGPVAVLSPAGENEDGDAHPSRAQVLEDFQARPIREANVQDKEVKVIGQALGSGLFTIVDNVRRETLVLKAFFQERADLRIILRD